MIRERRQTTRESRAGEFSRQVREANPEHVTAMRLVYSGPFTAVDDEPAGAGDSEP